MRSFAGLRESAIAAVVLLTAATVVHAQDASVEVDTVRARVQPDLEIELPSGIVQQQSSIPVGEAAFTVASRIDFITGSIAGDVSLSRNLSAISLTPFVELGVEANTDSPLVPEATESVDRARHATVGTDWWGWRGTFQLSTEIREDVRFTENGESGQSMDLFPRLAWEVSDLRPVLPSQTPETVGGWFRIEVTQRTELESYSAVDLRGRLAALLHHRTFDQWRWRHRMEFYSPLVVWNQERSGITGLGGFDSVRGFDNGAISTRRGAFSANTASFNLGSDEETGDTLEHIRFHSLRALGVADIGVYQTDYALATIPRVLAGIGTGLATTLSTPGGIHLDVELFVTLPVERSPMPVVYVRSSLFSLATDMEQID